MRRYLVLTLAILGCRDATTPAGPLAQVQLVSGGGQIGVVHTTLPDPIVARLHDAQGRVVRGQLVNFVVVQGGGHVFAGSAISNANGEVREVWTLGDVSGAQALEVRAVDQATGTPVVFARIEATAEAAPATAVWLSFTDTVVFLGQAIDLLPAVASANDVYGNDATYQTRTYSASAGWTVRNDSLIAPTGGESRGTVTVHMGDGAATIKVSARFDLRTLRWRSTYFCSDGFFRNTSPPRNVPYDSISAVATYDAIFYRGDAGAQQLPLFPNAELELRVGGGQTIRWYRDGVTDTVPTSTYYTHLVVARQVVDTLVYQSYWPAGVITSTSPRTYTGGDMCNLGIGVRNGQPLKLEAY